jgi:hypothetical protein
MAEVAGPGQFSRRTDKAVSQANRDLPDAGYGEQAQYQAVQQGMEGGAQPAQSPDFASLFGNPADRVVGLGADSTMPDVPVTDGADAGPGRGSEILPGSANQEQSNATMKMYLPALEFMANQPASSDAARNLVRMLKAQA